MLRIVCVQQGDYLGRGSLYVNILADSVRRNLPDGLPGTFECFTDDPTGLDAGIIARPLPSDLKGWWSKLYLFSPGLWPDGDRIVYFDLDTVILGRLDAIAEYDGPFAMLRDFYRPDGLGSGVMAWRSGHYTDIWASWEAEGRPEPAGGDQAWLEMAAPNANRLQDLFPGQLVSYKAHGCERMPPKGAKVCCFHGLPRPHDVLSSWVQNVWRVGGGQAVDFDMECNTEAARVTANIVSACGRDLPWLQMTEPHDRHAVIVGGGPSLASSLDDLRHRQRDSQDFFAINGALGWMLEHGLTPAYQVLLDARPETADFIRRPTKWYWICLLASQCDPAVFDKIEQTWGLGGFLYHPTVAGIADLILDVDKSSRPLQLIGGGNTVGLKAIAIAYVLGYRKIHLYGFDSSYRDGEHHAYPQALNDADRVLDVDCEGRAFKAAPWMVQQVNEFQELALELADKGCVITVHGDGLLPFVARQMMLQQAVAETAAAIAS